jgi:hypothetical protein
MSDGVPPIVPAQESGQGYVQEFEGNWYQVVNKADQLKYLFSWEEAPISEKERLITFLQYKFNVNIKRYKIDKTDNNKTILVSAEGRSISLSLNETEKGVLLEIYDGRTDNLIAKKEHNKLNIYGFIYDIMQGDIILGCPCAIPPADVQQNTENANVKIMRYNVIVMSQTCDIVQNKMNFVLVCPIWTLKALGEIYPHFKIENNKEALRRGYQHGFILLDECTSDGFEKDYFVVECKKAFSVPINTLKEIVKKTDKRLRLRSPYREYVSRSFANFFDRVALPKEINKFNKSFKLDHCEECEYKRDESSELTTST